VKLDCLICGAIQPQQTAEVEAQVLRPHTATEPPFHLDADRLWHSQPVLTGGQGQGHVTRPNASAKGTHGTIGRRVRIRAKGHLARRDEALLDHDLMADTRPGIEELGDSLLAHPLAHLDLGVGGSHRGRWRHVVDHHRHATWIENAFRPQDVTHDIDHLGRKRVVCHTPIHLHDHQVAGLDRMPGSVRQYLLG